MRSKFATPPVLCGILVCIIFLIQNGCDGVPVENDAGGATLHVYDAGKVFLAPPPAILPRIESVFEVHGPPTGQANVLVLSNLSCGCATCDFLDSKVDPGEKARIRVGYDLRYERGRRTEGAMVSFDQHQEARRVLKVTADVFPRILIDPFPLQPVQLLRGTTATKELRIFSYSSEQEPAVPPTMSVNCDGVSVKTIEEPMIEIKDGVRKISRIAVLSFANHSPPSILSQKDFDNYQPANIEGTVVITAGTFILERPISWRRIPFIRVSPEKPFLNARGSEGGKARIRLSAHKAFSIISAQSPDGNLSVEPLETGSSNEHLMQLRLISEKHKSMASRIRVTITTDHPDQKNLAIPVGILW